MNHLPDTLLRTARILPFALLFILAANGTAQFTSPPGYLSTEAGKDFYAGSVAFGSFREARYQFIDGEITSNVRVLNSVGVRHDFLNNGNGTSTTARAWRRVQLALSDGDHTRPSPVFTSNSLSTPTRVFSASVNWPGVVGYPKSKPAPWDPALRFPFSATYLSLKKDLLLDFRFDGGTIAGGGWSYFPTASYPYFLDGIHTVVAKTFARKSFPNMSTCRDPSIPAFPFAIGALESTQVTLYSATSRSSFAGHGVLTIGGAFTAPNSMAIHVLSPNGTGQWGLDVGARCNKLMVDLTAGPLYLLEKTGVYGSRLRDIRLGTLAALSPLGKIKIWSQAAWSDSRTGQFSLTNAELTEPDFAHKIAVKTSKMTGIFSYGSKSTTGWIRYQGVQVPILRYGY